jgi:hypothetical protein
MNKYLDIPALHVIKLVPNVFQMLKTVQAVRMYPVFLIISIILTDRINACKFVLMDIMEVKLLINAYCVIVGVTHVLDNQITLVLLVR